MNEKVFVLILLGGLMLIFPRVVFESQPDSLVGGVNELIKPVISLIKFVSAIIGVFLIFYGLTKLYNSAKQDESDPFKNNSEEEQRIKEKEKEKQKQEMIKQNFLSKLNSFMNKDFKQKK